MGILWRKILKGLGLKPANINWKGKSYFSFLPQNFWLSPLSHSSRPLFHTTQHRAEIVVKCYCKQCLVLTCRNAKQHYKKPSCFLCSPGFKSRMRLNLSSWCFLFACTSLQTTAKCFLRIKPIKWPFWKYETTMCYICVSAEENHNMRGYSKKALTFFIGQMSCKRTTDPNCYSRTMYGARYIQIFLTVFSRKVLINLYLVMLIVCLFPTVIQIAIIIWECTVLL